MRNIFETYAASEGTDQTAQMRSLILAFAASLQKMVAVECNSHYENTPIQIHWKFHHPKLKVFR